MFTVYHFFLSNKCRETLSLNEEDSTCGFYIFNAQTSYSSIKETSKLRQSYNEIVCWMKNARGSYSVSSACSSSRWSLFSASLISTAICSISIFGNSSDWKKNNRTNNAPPNIEISAITKILIANVYVRGFELMKRSFYEVRGISKISHYPNWHDIWLIALLPETFIGDLIDWRLCTRQLIRGLEAGMGRKFRLRISSKVDSDPSLICLCLFCFHLLFLTIWRTFMLLYYEKFICCLLEKLTHCEKCW